MSNVEQIRNDAAMKAVRDRFNALSDRDRDPYDHGGNDGGGGMSDLTPRVARLEEDVREIRTDMKDVRDRLSRIEGKIGMLPGWGGMMAMAGFIIGAVGLMIRFMPIAGQ